MFVKEIMTKNPISITTDAYISDVLDIFKEHDFHRLPVVDKSNHVIGLITGSTVSTNMPSKATSLSIHELNYLLNNTKVEDIMIKNVITIDPENLIEEAADKMCQNHVYALPVVDKGFLVGIITEKDIFSSFIDCQGYYNKGTRLVIKIDEDKPGILKSVATILSAKDISISHLIVERVNDEIRVVIRVDDTNGQYVADLLKNDFNIVDVRTYE